MEAVGALGTFFKDKFSENKMCINVLIRFGSAYLSKDYFLYI